MEKIKVKLPDNSILEVEKGTTAEEVVKRISEGLYRQAIGVVIDGELKDLTTKLNSNCELKVVKKNDPEAPNIYRHTMAHIMAQAVMRIYGKDKVKLAIGPVIENGFYYDFDIDGVQISEEDLPKIEEEMKKIIKEDLKIQRLEIPREEAIKMMEQENQIYKVEMLKEDIKDDIVSFYKQGEFIDLCRGPHLPSTGKIKHFKLLSVSGAYWRGDENNKMLQRIYGTAFAKKEDLDNYLKMLEEAKRRDHRKLGPQLKLFVMDSEIAPGMPFIQPRGAIVFNELMNFSRELHKEYGYKEVFTPLIMNIKLWKRSGHWDHFKENMYFTEKEDTMYAVKPMNCPGHITMLKKEYISYKDLPIKLFEFGKVHRYERSGVLHGLMRVRGFTQDDAHIFCREDQIEDQIIEVIELVNKIYSTFGFEYTADLSTMPEDHMGSEEVWEVATQALKKALDKTGIKYKISEGEGAFYGPKIDFHIRDSIGRYWQCATIQLDFLMPEKFDLNYIDSNNEEKRIVMIHRAIYGSMERFFGILIEHFEGAFPTWLSPEQVAILPVSEKYVEDAKELVKKLESENIRVYFDDSDSTVGYKIRNAQKMKIPYMIVFGQKEKESSKINIRTRKGNTVENVDVDLFIEKIKQEIQERKLDLSF